MSAEHMEHGGELRLLIAGRFIACWAAACTAQADAGGCLVVAHRCPEGGPGGRGSRCSGDDLTARGGRSTGGITRTAGFAVARALQEVLGNLGH